MKRPRVCQLLLWFVIGLGLTMVIVAFGAGYIGADVDNKWGPFRKGILFLGLACLLLPIGLKAIELIDRRLMTQSWSLKLLDRFEGFVKTVFKRSPENALFVQQPAAIETHISSKVGKVDVEYGELGEHQGLKSPTSSRFSIPRSSIVLVGAILVVELLYVFFVSVGHMTTWPTITTFYGVLAESFAQGEVSLLIEPDPRLAQLENPYPSNGRPGISVVGDASYYSGKYYFYWGPVPAIFAAVWQLVTSRVAGDEYIVFSAVSCIFLFSLLILLYLRRRYFPRLPGWLFLVGILIIATAHPILWVLNWPTIYPAAIASGQAFLIAGLFFAIPVIEGAKNEPWRLVLAGWLWALALGSRMSIAPALVLLLMATVIGLFFAHNGERNNYAAVKNSLILIMPMVIGIALIGYYNLIRFGDFLETGLRYQLSTNDLPRMFEQGHVFNPIYLLPNLFYYLIAPIRFRTMFPIIRPLWEELPAVSMFLARFNIPEVYRIEDISGILITTPSFVLIGFLIWELICRRRSRDLKETSQLNIERDLRLGPSFRRVMWTFLLVGVVALVPILFYYWVANRFLLDAVPLFAILAAVGAWLLYEATRGFPLRGPLAVIFILTTVFLGLLISFLLAISGADSRFDDINPALFETLSRLFSLKQ